MRTPEATQKYREHIAAGGLKECPLCTGEALALFTHWKVMQNAFPYDGIARVHDMLVPLRHSTEGELSEQELKELFDIKHGHLNEQYEYVMEATNKVKSIPAHFHLHLIVTKE